MSNSISVAVRVRPTLTKSVCNTVPSSVQSFSYPSTVVVGSNQSQCFEAVGAPLLARMTEGYNTTILAYGQTGSGKTYTMFGPTGSLSEASLNGLNGKEAPEDWGIFPRIALQMVASSGGTLRASAIEIYNNAPFDLLNNRKPLQVSRSKNAAPNYKQVTTKASKIGGGKFSSRTVGVNGEHPSTCTCRECYQAKNDAKEARKKKLAIARGEALPPIRGGGRSASSTPKKKFLRKSSDETKGGGGGGGGGARTVGETLWDLKTPSDVAKFARQIETSRVANDHALNTRSSRSHCLVRLQSTTSSSHDVGGGSGHFVKQCFTFIDLAGSERTGKSRVEGQMMSEAISINSSLTVLGRCIRAVCKNSKHVPWRDAVLCQLLKTSFEGKGSTHTVVVVNISPEHEDETLCTLRFGETVSCVTNRATIVIGQNADDEIGRLNMDIDRLRNKIQEMRKSGLSGGFVEGCIHSEKLSLMSNMEKLEGIQKQVGDLKTRLIETGDGSKRTVATIGEKLEVVVKAEYNMKMLVLRQQSIRGLWKDATSLYLAVVAELNERENQLRMWK